MPLPIRPALVLALRSIVLAMLPIVAAQGAPAAGTDPMPAVHANQWAQAEADAAGYADPVARKLVLYFRLLDPGAAAPGEIAAFMHDNPDWPNQALLERRREDAIVADTDDAEVVPQCLATLPREPAALLRCADALSDTGHTDPAVDDARRAWVAGLAAPAKVAALLQRWSGTLTLEDEWQRFQDFAWHDTAAAAAQIARLDPAHRPLADARIAFRRDDPGAEALLVGAQVREAEHPGLFLDHARYLRRASRISDAVALWQHDGTAAETAMRVVAPQHLAACWTERGILARDLLAAGDAAGAYAMADDPLQTAPEAVADSTFLAGFIALRKLGEPAEALQRFRKLAALSGTAITQARAWYWQGRAEAAEGKDPKPDYAKAAAWPTAFYGQLAALSMGEDAAALARRIDALRDPAWPRDAVLRFAGHEVVRAAAWLVAWGDAPRARSFLLRMTEIAPDPADRSLAAALALRLGLPDTAVFIARRMGISGLMLPQAGWPMPYDPPAGGLDPAIALGIMRQESSFDVGAVSPSGARGLMQLMPFTADAVARSLGLRTTLASLTASPEHNMRLGTVYLQQMLTRFDGSLPLAIAAYNAGPRRVEEWLLINGDPGIGPVDMIDWLEEIPVGETRNYVQRVLENITIYRARRGEETPTLQVGWAR
jgi:soluble lytic murein transglycosylase